MKVKPSRVQAGELKKGQLYFLVERTAVTSWMLRLPPPRKMGKCIIAVPGKVPDKNKLPTIDDIYETILGTKPSLALNVQTVKVCVPMR